MSDLTSPPSPHPLPLAEARSDGALVPTLLYGGITGVELSIRNMLFASFLFAGPVAVGVPIGTAVLLFSTAVMASLLALRSQFRCAAGSAQHASIAVLLPAFAIILERGGELDATAQVATMLAMLGTTAFAGGMAMWLIGRFGMGWVASLLPYPVAAGFLASSGLLLFVWALSVIASAHGLGTIQALGDPAALANLLPACGLALALLLVAYRLRMSYLVAVCLLLFAGGFYTVLWALDLTLGEARALSLLPALIPAESTITPSLSLYAAVDWDLVLSLSPVILGAVLFNVTSVMLNITTMELATNTPVEIDREIATTGAGNALIGTFGGAAAFVVAGSSMMANRLGVGGPMFGLSIAAIALFAALNASVVWLYLPLSLASGLLIFIGLSMMIDWIVLTRRRLPLQDWLLVLLIVAMTMVFGIMAAISAGLLFSIASFVVNYARQPVIRRETTGATQRSTVDRRPMDEEILSRDGDRTRVLQLQGYLFFGSGNVLAERLRRILSESAPPRFVIMNFADVTGLDSAACAVFRKMQAMGAPLGCRLIIAGASPEISKRLALSGLGLGSAVPAYDTTDLALEACEDDILSTSRGEASHSGLMDALGVGGGQHPRLPDLIAILQREEVAPGETVIRMNTRAADLLILDAGRLSVRIPATSGGSLRIRSVLPGTVVGEVARYMGQMRTADVVADMPSVVYRLTGEAMDRIDRDDPGLSALLHLIIARHLSEKLSKTNAILSGSKG